MERARVLIYLSDQNDTAVQQQSNNLRRTQSNAGVRRTSDTTLRLEHSDMSPGVANICFHRVYDESCDSHQCIIDNSLNKGIKRALENGENMTFLITGAANSGKSVLSHGTSNTKDVGLWHLFIQDVFMESDNLNQLDTAQAKSDFSLYFLCTKPNESDKLFQIVTESNASVAVKDFQSIAWQDCTRVETESDAICMYEKAKDCAGIRQSLDATSLNDLGKEADFCMVMSVRQHNCSGEVIQTTFLCIDLAGSGIIEPNSSEPMCTKPHTLDNDNAPSFMSRLPMNAILSNHFENCLGNDWVTYIMVAIRKSRRYQLQSIQSLLYACKAKEIKTNLKTKVAVKPSNQVENRCNLDSDPIQNPISQSTSNMKNSARISPARKQSLLSERLRRVYKNAKDATPQTACHSRLSSHIDKLLLKTTHLCQDQSISEQPSDEWTDEEKLRYIDKGLERCKSGYKEQEGIRTELEDTISRLRHSIEEQKVGYEYSLDQLQQEKAVMEQKLQEVQLQLISSEKLACKTTKRQKSQSRQLTNSPEDEVYEESRHELSPVFHARPEEDERLILQAFACRLEAAMEEAKGVVELKDARIMELENELSQVSQMHQVFETEIASLQDHFNREKENMSKAMTQAKAFADELQQQEAATQIRLGHAIKKLQQENERIEGVLRLRDAELQAYKSQEARYRNERDSEVQHLEAKLRDCQDALLRREFAWNAEKAAREAHRIQSRSSIRKAHREIFDKDQTIEALERHIVDLGRELDEQKCAYARRIKIISRQQHETQQALHDESQQCYELKQRLDSARSEGRQRECTLLADLNSAKDILRTVIKEKELLQQNIVDLKQKQKCADKSTQYEIEDDASPCRGCCSEKQNASKVVSLENDLRRILSRWQNMDGLLCPQCYREVSILFRESKHLRGGIGPQHNLNALDTHNTENRNWPSSAKSSPVSARNTSGSCETNMEQEREIQTLQKRAKQLVQALAVANEQETIAKKRVKQVVNAHECSERQKEMLLDQLNELKQENWSLNLALQVTRTAK